MQNTKKRPKPKIVIIIVHM